MDRVSARSAGGLCRLRGKQLIIVDGLATESERAAALAEALVEIGLPAELELSVATAALVTMMARRRHRLRRRSFRLLTRLRPIASNQKSA